MLFLLPLAFADDAKVVGIQELDHTGHWVDQGAAREAWVVRPDGHTELLDVGTLVPVDQEVVTQEARIRLQLAADKVVTLYENTKVVPKDWGVLQELGAALYDVHEAFRVQYGRTEAIVEGTRFRVVGSGTDADVVAVERGRVRVHNDLGEVSVPAGNEAVLHAGQAPELQPYTPGPELPPPGGGGTGPFGRGLGGRKWAVGVRVGGGAAKQAGQTAWGGVLTTELQAHRALVGPLRLGASLGLENSTETSGFPASLGLDAAFGGWSFGAHGELLFGMQSDCTSTTLTLRAPGGVSVQGGLEVPLGGLFLVDLHVTGGWVDGFYARGSAGLEVAF